MRRESRRVWRLPISKGDLIRLTIGPSDHYQIQRRTLIAELGRYCCCNDPDCWHEGVCQFSDFRALQLDHKNGDGVSDRLRFADARQAVVYYLKHLDEARQKLQVHCANCNWIKRSRNKEYGTLSRNVPSNKLL